MSQVVQDEQRERLTRFVAAASLVASSIYIVWRWGWTLDIENLWFSLPLVLAETYGLVAAAFLTYSAWSLRQRRPLPAPDGRTVDVFVTTADEPIAIIRKTALAARAIHYPHTTWILDDGHREDVRLVADEVGVRYLRRAERFHGKAGNLNHALNHSSGEFILQLDADHVPLPQIIERLLGFFEDERLAFAQSPQDFYNTSAFSTDPNGRGRQLWGDQQLFFNVLQPGKDRHDAAIFVGSCAMLRRAAIKDVGGFATNTTVVGTETSMLMHARGWRSAYLRENLAFGLAPATAHAYQMQQLHRAQGAMQALRRYQPLALRGLSRAQRIEYLHTLSTPLGSVQRLILYLAPIVFLTTGVFPIRASVGVFAAFFLPAALLRIASFRLLTRAQGSLWQADRYWMAKWLTHLLAVRSYLTPRRLTLPPRPDESGAVPLRTVAPQLTLIAITAAALAWATYAQTFGLGGDVPGWGALALIASVLLALWHAGLAAHVVQLSLAGRHRRAEYRFAESLSVGLRVIRADGKLASTDIAMTEDLTATGVALRCMYPIPDGARVELTLPLSGGEVNVRGHVVRESVNETQFGTVYLAGVEFDGTSRETRDAIELHCAQHAMPIDQQRQRQGSRSLAAFRRLRELRGERRVDVRMPAHVLGGSAESPVDFGVGLLEDVSPRGGRVVLDHPVEEGSEITLQIPGSTVRASGRVVFVHALETQLGMRFVAGFETAAAGGGGMPPEPWYAGIQSLLGRTAVTAAWNSVAVAGAAVEGTNKVAVKVVGDTTVAAKKIAEGSRVATTKLAEGSKLATTRITAGSRTAAEKLASGSRHAAEKLAASSRTAAEKLAAETKGAAARASHLSHTVTDAVVKRTSIGRKGIAHPADEIERVVLQPIDASFRQTPAESAPPVVAEPVATTPVTPSPVLTSPLADSPLADAPLADAPLADAPAADDPERAVEMEITGEFSFPMELTVGATFLIAEGGRVNADISTVHAIVLGSYAGTLRASRSIRVGPNARVEGVLEAPEVEIAEGAVIHDGSAAAGDEDASAGDAAGPDHDVAAPESSTKEEPASPASDASPAPSEPETDDEIFVASPIFTDGVSRG